MLIKQSTRRFIAILLVLLGATLIFLATDAWPGVVLVLLGVLLEIMGIALKHK